MVHKFLTDIQLEAEWGLSQGKVQMGVFDQPDQLITNCFRGSAGKYRQPGILLHFVDQ